MFSKLGFTLSKDECKDVALAQPGAIERVLKLVHTKLAQYQARHGAARTSRLHSYAEGAAAATGNNHFASPGRLQTPTTDANGHRTAEGSAWQHRARPSSAYEQDGFSPELAMDVTPPELKQSKHHPEEQQFKAAQLSRSPDDSGLIRSFMGREEREEELQELRALNKVLEVKASKMEQLLRLKDAKIAALTARLQEAGLA